MADAFLTDVEKRMGGSVESLKKEFGGLRTGRASAGMLEPIVVDAYGSKMPLAQVATISVPEARMLSVQVWDRQMVHAVEKSIRDSNLGLNPMTEGATLRIPVPELSQERRVELTKVAGKYAEAARVAIRNVRRDALDSLKKMEKDGKLSQDESRQKSEKVQKLTDDTIKRVDEALTSKEKEILSI